MKLHVEPRFRGWAVRTSGCDRARHRMSDKDRAVRKASFILRRTIGGGELIVHDRAGLVAYRRNFEGRTK